MGRPPTSLHVFDVHTPRIYPELTIEASSIEDIGGSNPKSGEELARLMFVLHSSASQESGNELLSSP